MILSIEQDFLQTLIPGLIQGFKNNSFQSKNYLETKYEEEINLQFFQESSIFPVILPIRGAIVKYTSYDYIGTQTYGEYIKLLDQHPNVSAIILDIDSGGGMISGTAELFSIIQSCQKPIIAFTSGYMCSAAYWIASACDKIICSPFADYIGSIGTMLQMQDLSKLFEKFGIDFYEIYAPQSTEKNKILRELRAGNQEPAKEHLEYLADNFIQTIKTARPQIKDDQKVFKGAVYSPEKAKEIGLVDELATLEQILIEL
jgi:signal peptide peptidase sppA, 36K type